jgi:hypothetical protein
MKRSLIPFFVFAALFVLTMNLSSDGFSLGFATSVVPGWHTTIFPPYFIMNSVLSIMLLLVTIAYWKISKVKKAVSWTVFVI